MNTLLHQPCRLLGMESDQFLWTKPNSRRRHRKDLMHQGLETNYLNLGHTGLLSLLHVTDSKPGNNLNITKSQKSQDMLKNDSAMQKPNKVINETGYSISFIKTLGMT